jgi:hypothetical protein
MKKQMLKKCTQAGHLQDEIAPKMHTAGPMQPQNIRTS